MLTYKVAILRGINVGGHRKILMADLKKMMTRLGYKDVSTYIQSGNVVFKAEQDEDDTGIATTISTAISKTFGYDVPVIIRDHKAITEVIEAHPWMGDQIDINSLHLTFLAQLPDKDHIRRIEEKYSFPPDRYAIEGDHVYIYCADKYHKSKLSNAFFEKNLGVQATTRNWKTVQKIHDMMMT